MGKSPSRSSTRSTSDKHAPDARLGNQSTQALAKLSYQESIQGVQTEKCFSDLEAIHPIASNGPSYSVFSIHQKRYIVFTAAFAGLFSSLSANTYFPALNTLSTELHVSDELINLTLTSYMIFQGLAPTIYGDLADMTGRRPAYILGFVIYIAANIGLALQKSYTALFILRCLQSTGSSGTVALGNGVVADISSMAERGVYMGIVTSGSMIGPAIGPIVGGILSQFLGFRSIFWFLVVLSVAFLIPFLIAFPETGRHIVGNGSIPPHRWNMSLSNYLRARKTGRRAIKAAQSAEQPVEPNIHDATPRLKWPNPLKAVIIIMEKDVAIILVYNALVYTAWYDVATSLPSLFGKIYGFNDLQLGLAFIPYGAGAVVASLLCGKLIDINYKRVAKTNNITIDRKRGDDLSNFPIEKARVQVLFPLLATGIGALVAYGWVLQSEAHVAVPLVLQFVIGLCLVGNYNVMSVMLVDLYPESPATVTAANNLVRCLLGAAGTAIVIQMIEAMGRGWCFTFIGAVLILASPMLWVEVQRGPGWREERRARVEGLECK